MTANELLTLVGLAWSRLVLYPGSLALCTLLWLSAKTSNEEPRSENWPANAASQTLRAEHGAWLLALSSIALPWLGLALLPLPLAAALSRTTDVIVVLALLEWPRLVAIAHDLHVNGVASRRAEIGRLAAALNSYPPLVLATLALAQPAGSLDFVALARAPGAAAPSSLQMLHWLGAIGWALVLPPALGLGPFRAADLRAAVSGRSVDALRIGLILRMCGLVAIAALPWLAPFGALDREAAYSLSTWLAIIITPLALSALLWAYDRLTAGQTARGWAYAYLALDGVLLLALLVAAYLALPGGS